MLLPYTVAVILTEHWNHPNVGRIAYIGSQPLHLIVYGQVGPDEWVRHSSSYEDHHYQSVGKTIRRWYTVPTMEVFQDVMFARKWGDFVETYDYPRAEFTELLANTEYRHHVRNNTHRHNYECPFCGSKPLATAPRYKRYFYKFIGKGRYHTLPRLKIKVRQKGRSECTECYAEGLRVEDVFALEGYFDDVYAPYPRFAELAIEE